MSEPDITRLDGGAQYTSWDGKTYTHRRPWVTLVIERDDHPVGFAHYRRFSDALRLDDEISERIYGPFVALDPGRRVVFLDSLWVDPEYRGQGIMSRFLDEIAKEKLPVYAGFREWSLRSWFQANLSPAGEVDVQAARRLRQRVLEVAQRHDLIDPAIDALLVPRWSAADRENACGALTALQDGLGCAERINVIEHEFGAEAGVNLVLEHAEGAIALAWHPRAPERGDTPDDRDHGRRERSLELLEFIIGAAELVRRDDWGFRNQLGSYYFRAEG